MTVFPTGSSMVGGLEKKLRNVGIGVASGLFLANTALADTLTINYVCDDNSPSNVTDVVLYVDEIGDAKTMPIPIYFDYDSVCDGEHCEMEVMHESSTSYSVFGRWVTPTRESPDSNTVHTSVGAIDNAEEDNPVVTVDDYPSEAEGKLTLTGHVSDASHFALKVWNVNEGPLEYSPVIKTTTGDWSKEITLNEGEPTYVQIYAEDYWGNQTWKTAVINDTFEDNPPQVTIDDYPLQAEGNMTVSGHVQDESDSILKVWKSVEGDYGNQPVHNHGDGDFSKDIELNIGEPTYVQVCAEDVWGNKNWKSLPVNEVPDYISPSTTDGWALSGDASRVSPEMIDGRDYVRLEYDGSVSHTTEATFSHTMETMSFSDISQQPGAIDIQMRNPGEEKTLEVILSDGSGNELPYRFNLPAERHSRTVIDLQFPYDDADYSDFDFSNIDDEVQISVKDTGESVDSVALASLELREKGRTLSGNFSSVGVNAFVAKNYTNVHADKDLVEIVKTPIPGLVAGWTFDDPDNVLKGLTDIDGIRNTAEVVETENGYGLKFDGDDYFEVPVIWDGDQDPLTYIVKLKLNSLTSRHAIFGEFDPETGHTRNYFCLYDREGGSLAFDQWKPSGLGALVPANLESDFGRYVNIAILKGHNRIIAYKDGSKIGEKELYEKYSGTVPKSAMIGGRDYYDGLLDGLNATIEQILIYENLSEREIKEITSREIPLKIKSSLKAEYDFSSNNPDFSSIILNTGNHEFDGERFGIDLDSGEYVAVPMPFERGKDNLTYTVTLRLDGLNARKSIFGEFNSKSGHTRNYFCLYDHEGGSLAFDQWRPSGLGALIPAGLKNHLGEWITLTLTKKGTNVFGYKNSKQAGYTICTEEYSGNTPTSAFIGARDFDDGILDGLDAAVSSFKAYSSSLTKKQVTMNHRDEMSKHLNLANISDLIIDTINVHEEFHSEFNVPIEYDLSLASKYIIDLSFYLDSKQLDSFDSNEVGLEMILRCQSGSMTYHISNSQLQKGFNMFSIDLFSPFNYDGQFDIQNDTILGMKMKLSNESSYRHYKKVEHLYLEIR